MTTESSGGNPYNMPPEEKGPEPIQKKTPEVSEGSREILAELADLQLFITGFQEEIGRFGVIADRRGLVEPEELLEDGHPEQLLAMEIPIGKRQEIIASIKHLKSLLSEGNGLE